MTKAEAAPDPTGSRPDEFPERQWPAYQRWATGATRAEAADAAGVASSTMGRWVKKWRTHYDTTALNARTAGLTDEAREAGCDASALVRWVERRAQWADDQQPVMEKMSALVSALLAKSLDPTSEAIDELEPGEASLVVTRIVRSIDVITRIADRLASIPSLSPVRVQETIEVELGEVVDEHTLDALFGDGDTNAEILAGLSGLRDEHQADQQSDDPADPAEENP